jgi:hypothetical protein
VALVWAVPVVAAAVAAMVVAAAARPVGDELIALVDDVRRLRELREPLARVRATTEDSAALAASYRRRHRPVTPPGVSGDAGGVPPNPG